MWKSLTLIRKLWWTDGDGSLIGVGFRENKRGEDSKQETVTRELCSNGKREMVELSERNVQ